MGQFRRSHQHGPPLLGRVQAPSCSPTSLLVCSPPIPSLPSAAATVFPCLWPTSRRVLVLCCTRQPAACASRKHTARRRLVTDSPRSPVVTRRNEGLPGFWAILFKRAVVVDPAGRGSLLAHGAATAVAFRLREALGTQDERHFVAATPTAHLLAHLRIDERVTADAARLATGWAG